MKNKILISIAIPFAVVVLVLAYRSAHSLYNASIATDSYVQNFCGQATSKELTCWCYNELARTCPFDK